MLARMSLTLSIVLAISNSASARAVYPWTYEELKEKSDVVIIASVASTEPFDELLEVDRRHPKNQRPEHELSIFERGTRELDAQLTTFKLKAVIKGTVNGKRVQVIHYNVGKGDPGQYQGGARVAEFQKDERRPEISNDANLLNDRSRKRQYLLFLKLRKDGKFEPASGQIDSAFSVMELRNALPFDE
jgi:hypothetical protein